jgi:hypothetical protein
MRNFRKKLVERTNYTVIHLGRTFWRGPSTRRGLAVQRKVPQFGLAILIVVAVCLPASAAVALSSGAAITGVVRDVQGVAQAGALVQVLALGLETPRSTFTDLHGRYSIANLVPGKYAVQASAALYIPSGKDNLQLRPGKWSVVNLTLATLFDTSAWLPAQRRRPDEADDDWKWTLRSSASRPMLRMVGEDEPVMVSSSASESHKEQTQTRASFSSGDGGFGQGGSHNVLMQDRQFADGSNVVMRLDVGMPGAPVGVGPSTEIDLGFGRNLGFGGATRTVLSYQNHSEISSSGGGAAPGPGLMALQLASAQQMAFGDSVKVEFGSEIYAVHSVRNGVASSPFLRIDVLPTPEWTVEYRMATSRDLQSFEDLDTLQREVPVAVSSGEGLRTEHGQHQELSLSRKAGRGVVQVALYHDGMDRPALCGGGLLTATTGDGSVLGGVLADPSTYSFRLLGPGYAANGMNFLLSEPISAGMWAALEYSTGSALSASAVTDGLALDEAAASLHAISSKSATFAVKGRLIRSGTKLRAAYRWQPTGLVTAVDPYRAFSDQAYLSFTARQPIHIGRLLPSGLEGVVSVTNLLAQGYRPFLSADGSTLFFAQSPRTIEGGLSLSF